MDVWKCNCYFDNFEDVFLFIFFFFFSLVISTENSKSEISISDFFSFLKNNYKI